MPMLPVIAVLAVVVAMLAAIGSRSPAPQAQVAQAPAQVAVAAKPAGPAAAPVAPTPAATPAQVASAPGTATALIASTFTPEQKKSIEQIVKDYLVNNPEVLAEAQASYEQKQEASRAEMMKKAMTDLAPQLFRSSTAPVAGNPKGDVTVVEFFDYNCGYCKKALGDIAKLIESDKKVKVLLRELPIFGKDSEGAARVAVAAKKQNKYWEVHRGLLERRGKADEAAGLEIAQAAGLNMEQLRKDMTSAEVKKELDEVKMIAEKMGIQGTPHFFVADKVIPGAPDNLFEVMTKHVADVRKSGGCKVC
jgi:protein-disulfide isomerase